VPSSIPVKKATTLCRNAVGLRFHEPASKVGAKSLGASYLADAASSTGANRTSNLGEIRPPADLFIGSAEILGSARTWQKVIVLNRTSGARGGQEAECKIRNLKSQTNSNVEGRNKKRE
jgi:hypothetical protein